jgi:WD40 repeat protein
LRLWDGATGKPIGEALKGHSSSVQNVAFSVAFSPDGKRIVSGSSDNTLWLWDGATGKPIGEPIKGHSNSVRSVAFSPDGKRILSGSSDNTLRLWEVLDSWADELCAKLPRNMSRGEWKQWVGDIPYQRQCPNLPGPPDEIPVKTQAASSKR